MVARRGKPEEVISDNGTNFVGANRELGELICAMDQSKIIDSAANQGIKWKFNPPLGSHHGGLFESLIKSVKIALKAILGNARVTDEELHTAIVEVEGLMNSRPLTYCSNDPTDEPVLTPNHFLGHWPLGRILETYPGEDGHVRTVKVTSGGKTFIRPITKLCPMEVEVTTNEEVTKPVGQGGEDGATKTKSSALSGKE
ncbi:uncharacterized protein LOC144446859 [Glandiceps talaboti]